MLVVARQGCLQVLDKCSFQRGPTGLLPGTQTGVLRRSRGGGKPTPSSVSALQSLGSMTGMFEIGSSYVAWADLKLILLLPQAPKCWSHRHIPLFQALRCVLSSYPENRYPCPAGV